MSPTDPSSAPKLELFCKLQADKVPFIAKANVPSVFGKFTVYGFLEKVTGKGGAARKRPRSANGAGRTPTAPTASRSIGLAGMRPSTRCWCETT